MPGPKMGARPLDFDEGVVKQSPTYQKWLALEDGQKLRYACRDFIKGHGDDEERLMRRIMIARRNNLRDHEILKRARSVKAQVEGGLAKGRKDATSDSPQEAPVAKKRRVSSTAYSLTDEEIRQEMDEPAVEATRSYKAWLRLEDGKEFTYNQRYCKGKEGHDWLLKKNIWRRMRYRRENKKMVDKLMQDGKPQLPEASNTHSNQTALNAAAAATATQIVDEALLAGAGAVHVTSENAGAEDAIVEAAVAAAESFISETRKSDSTELVPGNSKTDQATVVHNPIIDVAPALKGEQTHLSETTIQHHTPNPLVEFGALDVAAKLAAAASAADPQIADESSQGEFSATPVQV